MVAAHLLEHHEVAETAYVHQHQRRHAQGAQAFFVDAVAAAAYAERFHVVLDVDHGEALFHQRHVGDAAAMVGVLAPHVEVAALLHAHDRAVVKRAAWQYAAEAHVRGMGRSAHGGAQAHEQAVTKTRLSDDFP
ncbi:hypothetical protein [Rhodanobacter soli]